MRDVVRTSIAGRPVRHPSSRAYRSLVVLSATAMAATAFVTPAGPASAGVNPGGGRNTDGTPAYVRDAQGVALQMCTDSTICEPATPPHIGVYYTAEAQAGPVSASWAIEAEYMEDATGSISDRAAVSNAALFRAEGLRPNRLYRIRDPWRWYRCRADDRGRLTNKNCMFEGGGEAGGPIRRGPIKSFLVPRFSLAPGLVGGTAASRVKGSPDGFNAMVVRGPGVRARTAFFEVAGQLRDNTPMGLLSRKRLRLVNRHNLRPVRKVIRYWNVGTARAVVRTRRAGQAGAFAVDNRCRDGVAPRRVCRIVVTYTPVRRRNKSATLIVSDNTLAKPREIALTGIAPR